MTKKADKARAKTEAAMAAASQHMIDAIEAGLADPDAWVAPWVKANATPSFNPVTKRAYTGANWLMLAIAEAFLGAEAHWATYKQWATIDAQVRKGEKGTVLFRPITRRIEDPATGETRYAAVPGMFSTFTVFASNQVDGYEPPVVDLPEIAPSDAEEIDAAYAFAEKVTGRPVVEAGDAAFYSITGDYIGLPKRDRWTSAIGCWSTVAHEATHWTGHESRLDRAQRNLFGTPGYALEELVAEMGAAMFLAATGRVAEPRADHLDYLANWLKALREQPRALFTAAAAASKAATMLVDLTADETVAVAA